MTNDGHTRLTGPGSNRACGSRTSNFHARVYTRHVLKNRPNFLDGIATPDRTIVLAVHSIQDAFDVLAGQRECPAPCIERSHPIAQDGNRIYTLKKSTATGAMTKSAHPGKSSEVERVRTCSHMLFSTLFPR